MIYVVRDELEIDPRLLNLEDREALHQGERAAYVIHARDLRHGER